MTTIFKKENGKDFIPQYFAVFYKKDGTTFRKPNYDDANAALHDHPSCLKVEVYKNNKGNLAADLEETAINK